MIVLHLTTLLMTRLRVWGMAGLMAIPWMDVSGIKCGELHLGHLLDRSIDPIF